VLVLWVLIIHPVLFDRVGESQSGSSKADFTNKVRISLREMRESNYWLRILKRTVKEVNGSDIDYLVKESGELKNILGSIVQKSRD
jgi:four helix bundle protein